MLKKKNAKIIAIVLLLLLTFGVIFSNADSWLKNEDGQVQVYSIYESGTINSKGNNQEVEDHIRTKNAFDCKGLKIELAEKSSLSYCLYFYDSDEKFLGLLGFSSSMTLEDLENNDKVTYYDRIAKVRIVIGADYGEEKIEWHDYYDYIKRIDVFVDAEQE